LSEIERAKTNADTVIVLVHGGNECSPVPSPRIIRTYRAFVDAGASTVVGTHPHVPQGYEIYNNAPIFYSIGNLVLDFAKKITRSNVCTLWSKGFVVRLHLQKHVVKDFGIIPYKALTETGCLRLLEGEELNEFVDYIKFLSGILGNEREVKAYWDAWCALMGPRYLRSLSRFSLIDFLYPLMPTRNPASKGFLVTRNIMACQSHNELLTTFMDLLRKKRIDAAKKYIPRLQTLQKGVIP
jgi:poly-gamma-glutamate synthesis protein (capsule biosynthesis protein)